MTLADWLSDFWPAAPTVGACLLAAAYLVARRRTAGRPGLVAAAGFVLLAWAQVAGLTVPHVLRGAGPLGGLFWPLYNTNAVVTAVVVAAGAAVVARCVVAGRPGVAGYADRPG